MKHGFFGCTLAALTLVGIAPSLQAQTVQQARVWFASGELPAMQAFSSSQSLPVFAESTKGGGNPSSPLLLRFLGWGTSATTLRATFVTDKPIVDDFGGLVYADFVLPLPLLAPGTYTIELATADGKVTDMKPLTVSGAAATSPATSLNNRRSGKFFLTAASAEVTSLLALSGLTNPQVDAGGVHWGIAEQTMNVWPATGDAPPAAKPVCRLYHPQAVTHFYSANEADCALVRKTAPWVDEGIAFKALTPSNGACPTGTDAVYRLFSATLGNHAYTRSTATVTAFGQTGWVNEGVVFCSPKS